MALELPRIPDDVQALREKALGLNAEISERYATLRQTLRDLQAACNHALIAEAPYRGETTFSNAQPPMRACEVCGLYESAWHFKHLTGNRVRNVSRDALLEIRNEILGGTRVGIDDDDKPEKAA